ncbi:ATP-binding protein [Ornithinimicrobium cryptoxanthini]|uniref:ATP-binding protein n=1 Tax=Ornithinimicrobium cryptoxanthini TaxID=2934161 RepID=UPI002117D2E1|nr:LuxR C-terminal-related transcriptional regulator [Ornithinimicrobium cryptoxanthini]
MGAAHTVQARAGSERNSFVGRRQELADVRRVLSTCRLLTLVGPGGVGKTRLALRATSELRRLFPGGTFTVDLMAVRSGDLVAQQVAAALHVRDLSGEHPTDQMARVIGDGHVLLVVDNCEHVRDSVATVLHSLLSACPNLSVLGTSRLPLDVDGESLLVVPPLGVEPTAIGPDHLQTCEALQLLQKRAEAVAPTLRLTTELSTELLEICRRLDGLPLAIELAAVRLRTLSPEEILVRLDDRFRLLRRSGATIPERHRTLLATMQWSYDLLPEPARLLWRRASVFVDGFDVTAVEAVCADDVLTADVTLDALAELVDASVVGTTSVGGASYFRMLDSVRAFGEGLLTTSEEAPALQRRHRKWCSAMTAAQTQRFLGPEQVVAFDLLSRHHHEISTALDFCVSTPGEETAGLVIASDLWLYWEARGRLTEGRRRLDTLLAACPDDSHRARALAVAGYLALAGTDTKLAVPLLTQARRLAMVEGDSSVVAMATQYLGQAALFDGELDTAETLLREAAAQHLPLDERLSAFCWADIGVVALLQGRLDNASEAFTRSLAQNATGSPWSRAHALWGLGLVHLGHHDVPRARDLERESLVVVQAVDDLSGSALCVGALACVAAEEESWDLAARLSGAERMLWRSIPAEVPVPIATLHHDYQEATRRALGARRWAMCHEEGSALDRSAAVSLALGQASVRSPAAQSGPPAVVGLLTDRQLEVAHLVSAGLTDREVAARLVISPRTAESHVEHILTRLGLHNRAEIAAWTVRNTTTS